MSKETPRCVPANGTRGHVTSPIVRAPIVVLIYKVWGRLLLLLCSECLVLQQTLKRPINSSTTHYTQIDILNYPHDISQVGEPILPFAFQLTLWYAGARDYQCTKKKSIVEPYDALQLLFYRVFHLKPTWLSSKIKKDFFFFSFW